MRIRSSKNDGRLFGGTGRHDIPVSLDNIHLSAQFFESRSDNVASDGSRRNQDKRAFEFILCECFYQ